MPAPADDEGESPRRKKKRSMSQGGEFNNQQSTASPCCNPSQQLAHDNSAVNALLSLALTLTDDCHAIKKPAESELLK